MVCIYCNGPTQVVNSRLQRRSNNIWRRRQCSNCGNIFTTHEAIELESVLMVQKNKHTDIEPFARDILFTSIYDSCRHRQNAISDASALTQTVIGKILKLINQGTIHRNQIVDTAFETLEKFDKASATMYLAYHPRH